MLNIFSQYVWLSLTKNLPGGWYSVLPIYRGRVYRGIGYIAVACWTPIFWCPRAPYFSRNRGNTLDPIRGRHFFAKSARCDRLCWIYCGFTSSNFDLWWVSLASCQHVGAWVDSACMSVHYSFVIDGQNSNRILLFCAYVVKIWLGS